MTEDDGLTAPGGQPIQSVSFCYVVAGEDDNGGGGQAGGGEATEAPPATDTEALGASTGSFQMTGAALAMTGLVCLGAASVVVFARRRAAVAVAARAARTARRRRRR